MNCQIRIEMWKYDDRLFQIHKLSRLEHGSVKAFPFKAITLEHNLIWRKNSLNNSLWAIMFGLYRADYYQVFIQFIDFQFGTCVCTTCYRLTRRGEWHVYTVSYPCSCSVQSSPPLAIYFLQLSCFGFVSVLFNLCNLMLIDFYWQSH